MFNLCLALLTRDTSNQMQPNAKWHRFKSGWLHLIDIIIYYYLEIFKSLLSCASMQLTFPNLTY